MSSSSSARQHPNRCDRTRISTSDTLNMTSKHFRRDQRPFIHFLGRSERKRGKRKNIRSSSTWPRIYSLARLISFGCIILSVSMANLTVPKARAPDWSIQNQTTNYCAHHSPPLLPTPCPSSPSFTPPPPAAVGSGTQEQQSASVGFPLASFLLKACPITALRSCKHARGFIQKTQNKTNRRKLKDHKIIFICGIAKIDLCLFYFAYLFYSLIFAIFCFVIFHTVTT